jgi:hypothetical protein
VLLGPSFSSSSKYSILLKLLRKLSWASFISAKNTLEAPIKQGVFHRLQDVQAGALPTSGGRSTLEGIYMMLNQWPVYLLHLIYVMAIIFPKYFTRMIFSKIINGDYGVQTEEDVVDLILSTPAHYIMCKPVSAEQYTQKKRRTESLENDIAWLFHIPKELPGQAYHGDLIFNDVSIVFLPTKRRIISAQYQRQTVDPKTEAQMLFAAVVSSSNSWIHFNSHIMAEISAEEIQKGEIEMLEPSARFVHDLHSGLLNSPLSPAVTSSPLFTLSVTRQCFEERFAVKVPHYLDNRKASFPGYRFLLAARKSIQKHLERHNLPVSPEPLFQNMVVHSLDHYLCHCFLRNYCFSLDGSETAMSYIRGMIYVHFWMPPKVNLLDDVRLCTLATASRPNKMHQFYVDFYQDVVKIDPTLANQIIMSTSF